MSRTAHSVCAQLAAPSLSMSVRMRRLDCQRPMPRSAGAPEFNRQLHRRNGCLRREVGGDAQLHVGAVT